MKQPISKGLTPNHSIKRLESPGVKLGGAGIQRPSSNYSAKQRGHSNPPKQNPIMKDNHNNAQSFKGMDKYRFGKY